MNPDEYNELSRQLENRLNQKGTLLDFRVSGFSDSRNPQAFTVNWWITINGKLLKGSCGISTPLATEPEFDIVEYILKQAMITIEYAILEPEEIRVI